MLRRSAPVPTRAPSSARGRAGFTLIELLVVIAIIAALVGLTIAGVMRVLGAGPRAQTSSTLSALANGINTFASERSVPYIPSGTYDFATNRWTGPFRLRNSYTSTTNPNDQSFEAQYISRVFGRVTLDNLGNPAFPGNDTSAPITLDANQTLLFFVNGIQDSDGQGGVAFRGFQKGQKPFAPFTKDENRLGPYFGEITARQYVASGREFARIIDGWRTPLAYFTAYNAKPAVVNSGGAYGGNNPLATGLVGPYFTGTGYANPSGFQLISAGENKRFGAGGNWANVSPDGADDRANFSPNNLGAGPQ
jgi:prepilin-type N-terminal cleavage/methylation domain-containing protein